MMVKKFIIGMVLGATVSAGYAVETSALSQEDTAREFTVTPAKSQEAVPQVQAALPTNFMVNLVHNKVLNRFGNVISLSALIIAGGALISEKSVKNKMLGFAKIGCGLVLGLKALQYIFSQDEEKVQIKSTFQQKAWQSLGNFAPLGAVTLSIYVAWCVQKDKLYSLWG